MDLGKDFFFGTKFSFFGDQGDLFRRLHHISSEVVPISSEVVLIALLLGGVITMTFQTTSGNHCHYR